MQLRPQIQCYSEQDNGIQIFILPSIFVMLATVWAVRGSNSGMSKRFYLFSQRHDQLRQFPTTSKHSYQGLKRPGREADLSFPSSSEVTYCSCTSTLPTCLRKTYRDTFNFTFTFVKVLQALLIIIRKSTSEGPIRCADKLMCTSFNTEEVKAMQSYSTGGNMFSYWISAAEISHTGMERKQYVAIPPYS